ncbi:MAG: hypothetical protein GF364_14820 [Candidatus Lokiarchaeota archaeon]|nr:hypothetical protein [Candidatus Lokiarchaeota archaeon]
MSLDFILFDEAGKKNTEKSLEIAKKNAEILNIKNIVIASTSGFTAKKALDYFNPKEYNLVVVTHNYGFKEKKPQEMDEKTQQELKSKGINIVTGTLAFSGVDSALQKKFGYWDFLALYAKVLRIVFCDGIKVCQEIMLMAADAGAIPLGDNIITVAGTGAGADTVCQILSSSSRKFLDSRVKAIFAKPK